MHCGAAEMVEAEPVIGMRMAQQHLAKRKPSCGDVASKFQRGAGLELPVHQYQALRGLDQVRRHQRSGRQSEIGVQADTTSLVDEDLSGKARRCGFAALGACRSREQPGAEGGKQGAAVDLYALCSRVGYAAQVIHEKCLTIFRENDAFNQSN